VSKREEYMKKITTQRFHEAYTALRVAAILALLFMTFLAAVKLNSHVFDCEIRTPEWDRMDKDHEDRLNRESHERVSEYERGERDKAPSDKDYERSCNYEREYGV
jgi:hypothetical protein